MKLAWIIFSLTLVIGEGQNIPSRPPECDPKPVNALLVSGILDTQEGREAVGAIVAMLPLNSTVTVGDITWPKILIQKFIILNDSDAGNVKATLDMFHYKSSNVLKSENFEYLVQATFRARDLQEPSNIVFLITGNQVLDRNVSINMPILYVVSLSDPGKDTFQIATDPQHRLTMKQLSAVQSLLCEDYRDRNIPITSTPVTVTSATTTVKPAQDYKYLVIVFALAAFVLLLLVVGILAARKCGRLNHFLQCCKRKNSSESTLQVAESVQMIERRPTCDSDGNCCVEDGERDALPARRE